MTVGADGGRQTLKLIVQPLRMEGAADSLYIVVFQDVGAIDAEAASSLTKLDMESATHQLELELRATRERLQTSTEELESSNEELKSANEELSSIVLPVWAMQYLTSRRNWYARTDTSSMSWRRSSSSSSSNSIIQPRAGCRTQQTRDWTSAQLGIPQIRHCRLKPEDATS